MEVVYTKIAKSHLKYWKESGQKKVQQRIQQLINSIEKTPFEGIGKPEELKHNWAGFWSREITKKDRLIYTVGANIVTVYSLKTHYFDK